MALAAQTKLFNTLLQQIRIDYPVITFMLSSESRWEPRSKTIFYNPKQDRPEWSLLHELGHMQAQHSSYSSDVQLLAMELEAWELAKVIAKDYSISVDQGRIDECMDSYRDWLHKRSSCPRCHQTGVQGTTQVYRCPNCHEQWSVSSSRFCRPYRKKQNTPH